DNRIANLGEGSRKQAPNTPESGQLIFETQRIVSETSNPGTALDDLKARTFQVRIQPVPNDDFLDAGLLEAFANGVHELRARAIPPSCKTIHLEPDHFAGPHDLLPGLEG